MNSKIQYTHLGDTVSFYQVAKNLDNPILNDEIVNFKGHNLKKIAQPNQTLSCSCISCTSPRTAQRRNTDDIFRCVQPNCYFGITEKELTTQQNGNDTPKTLQEQQANASKINEITRDAFMRSEREIKGMLASAILNIMPSFDFDQKLTKSEIEKNIQIQAKVTLNEEYANSLICNTQPCPYLNSIFNKKHMRAAQGVLTARGVEIIKQLVTDIMKQQNININMQYTSRFTLLGTVVNNSSYLHIRDVEYDLNKYMIGHYITAFEALSTLIKEVEFDKILIKLSRVYPQAFDKNSNVFIDTWDRSKQTITFGYKNLPVSNYSYSVNNQSYQLKEININTFCSVENMIFNFDLLKEVLDSTPNLSYDKLFEASSFSSFGRPRCEQRTPIGQLSPDMFVRLPV